MPDSSPSAKSRKGGGKKNDDGREGGGKEGPKHAPFNDKAVHDMPNEGAPTLPGKGTIAKII
jgi:hypothetical protein